MDIDGVLKRTLATLNDDAAVGRLRAYFHGTREHSPFTGSVFETIGHHWDADNTSNTVTAADLLALSTLSVPVSGPATVWMLAPQNLRRTEELLSQVPTSVDIRSALDQGTFDPGSPTNLLWTHLRKAPGFGPVSTSKLLARKRGNLLPIWDTMVGQALGLPNSAGHWSLTAELFARDRHGLWQLCDELREQADVDPVVSPLRIFDVVLWHTERYSEWR